MVGETVRMGWWMHNDTFLHQKSRFYFMHSLNFEFCKKILLGHLNIPDAELRPCRGVPPESPHYAS